MLLPAGGQGLTRWSCGPARRCAYQAPGSGQNPPLAGSLHDGAPPCPSLQQILFDWHLVQPPQKAPNVPPWFGPRPLASTQVRLQQQTYGVFPPSVQSTQLVPPALMQIVGSSTVPSGLAWF